MDAIPKKSHTKIAVVTGIAALVFWGFYRLAGSVPSFAVSLEEFGEDLPLPTRFFLDFHYLVFGFLALLSFTAVVWFLASKPGTKGSTISFLYTLASPGVLFLSWVFLLGAMYLPAFRLG